MFRRRFIAGSAVGLALISGCLEQAEQVRQAMDDDEGGEGQKSQKKKDEKKAKDEKDKKEEFSADLSGENEVPSVDTDAEGEATFTLADHGEGPHLHYELFVENIENVTQAHIHVGGRDENGDVVAFLFGAKEGGEFVGALEESDAVDVGDRERLAEGSIIADDLVGPLEGMDLAALAEEMRTENTYVNVHTTQNPAGEIRGQIVLES